MLIRRSAQLEFVPVGNQATFQGYRRHNGKAATRNYIGCPYQRELLGDGRALYRESVNREVLGDHPNVNGVVAACMALAAGWRIP